jgi:hypothetical protein
LEDGYTPRLTVQYSTVQTVFGCFWMGYFFIIPVALEGSNRYEKYQTWGLLFFAYSELNLKIAGLFALLSEIGV